MSHHLHHATSMATSKEFRNETLPKPTSKQTISSEAPALLSLLSQSPHLKIITPSSPSFAKFNKIYNKDTTSVPLALIRPTSESDVATIVRFAVSASPPVPICVRGGGLDFWDRSNVNGSLVIDLKEMDSVEVVSDKKSAIIGGGTISLNLARCLETHGLVATLGGCYNVGITG